jgi:hypothetical protein
VYYCATCVQLCCSEIKQARWGSLGQRIPNSPAKIGSRSLRCHRDCLFYCSGGESPVLEFPMSYHLATKHTCLFVAGPTQTPLLCASPASEYRVTIRTCRCLAPTASGVPVAK